MMIDYISVAYYQPQGYLGLGFGITWSTNEIALVEAEKMLATARLYGRDVITFLHDRNITSEIYNKSVTTRVGVKHV